MGVAAGASFRDNALAILELGIFIATAISRRVLPDAFILLAFARTALSTRP